MKRKLKLRFVPVLAWSALALGTKIVVDWTCRKWYPITPIRRALHFTVSIEAAVGCTTGVSAKDRATTIKAAANPEAKPTDLLRPGHVYPLRARPNGVFERRGHTEATVDLMRLAGLNPTGVLCELMNDDGTMAKLPQVCRFADEHNLCVISVNDLVLYRQAFDC